jgi:AbrB family looped-hinge helix DNA binding protein
MLAKLSSKGHLVIPKSIRKALDLRPGTEMHIEIADRKIILEPVAQRSLIDSLYGKYADADLLTDLEAEHRQELDDEKPGR